MAPRLKVFVTSDGLTDYVVAASSKAKALTAWGVRQDVFKEGAAHQTDDPALVKAATARPGEVLRRPAGTRDKLARLKPAKAAKPAGPTKAQLKKVATLEKQLADLDAEHDQAARRPGAGPRRPGPSRRGAARPPRGAAGQAGGSLAGGARGRDLT